jgi:hypothetical protein
MAIPIPQGRDATNAEAPIAAPPRMTFGRWANAFIPSAALALAALVVPEVVPLNVDHARTLYTIRAATLLVTPALCLFLFRDRAPEIDSYWLLFWTFSYLAYLVHFYWAVWVIFNGDIPLVFRTMGWKIAGPNFVLTAWWGFDVLASWIAWLLRADPRWLRIERWGAHVFTFAVFAVTMLVLKSGFVRPLGYALVAAVGICFVAWLTDRLMARGTTRWTGPPSPP